MTETQTTPRPWRAEGLNIIGNELNGFVCSCSGREANAAFIARACNCHEELVDVLEKCKLWHQGDKWRAGTQPEFAEWQFHRDVIDAALRKAKGEI